MKTIPTSQEVIEAILAAKTPGQKAAATKKLNAYVDQKVSEDKKASQVRAAIAAHVTRRR